MKGANKTSAPQFFTTYDIGRMTGTDPTTVHKWIDKGLMRGHRTPGGHRRVRGDDLKVFLVAHQMPIPRELGGSDVLRVVVVDDDADVLKTVSKAIKRLKPAWEVVTFDSGVKALLSLGKATPDVLVLDLFMPECDGFAVCKQIRSNADAANVRLIAVTGRFSSDVEKKAISAGANAVMKKPVVGPELVEAIEVAVGMRPSVAPS